MTHEMPNGRRLGELYTESGEKGEDGLPLLSVTLADGLVDRESLDRKMETKLSASEHLRVRPNDIAYNMMRMWQGAAAAANREGLVSPAYVVARPKVGIDSRYVIYLLKTQRFQHQLWTHSHGVTDDRLRLYFDAFAQIKIPLPPLAEQQRIAEILSTWDAAIEQTKKLLDAKQRSKRALAQLLLTGKRRFREFEGERWKQARFGSFLTESREAGSDGARAQKISVKLYGLGVVSKSETREGSENTKYYLRRHGQFIYSKLDFLNGAFGIVPRRLDGWESTLDLPCFDINREVVEPDWLLAYVVREEFYTNCLGSAMGGRKARRVSPEEFLAMHVKLPSLAEQQKIAAVLNTADQEVVQLKDQLAALRRQKQGLMQVLLTGKVRVTTSRRDGEHG